MTGFLQACITIFPLPLLLLVVLSGCATTNSPHTDPHAAIFKANTENTQENFPLFLVKNPDQPFNRIGTPTVRTSSSQQNKAEAIVSPETATIYHDIEDFQTSSNSYRNEIFRIHFERVPLGFPFINLTVGRNPGLLIIYTYNNDELVLITTVHTCGCYLAFLPTDKLHPSAYPENWPDKQQSVYGYSLPSKVSLPHDNASETTSLIFTIENETHRVSNVAIADNKLIKSLPSFEMRTAPMSSLYKLVGSTKNQKEYTSFFELAGNRQGYVKNNVKWLEKIFLGWLALDLKVGEDKAYKGGDVSSTRLYTSLKFWARSDSDLKNFPRFLKYWGWNL